MSLDPHVNTSPSFRLWAVGPPEDKQGSLWIAVCLSFHLVPIGFKWANQVHDILAESVAASYIQLKIDIA